MFCEAVDCAHLRVFQGAAGAGESSIDAADAGQASDANAVRSRHVEPILHKVNLALFHLPLPHSQSFAELQS